MAECVDYYDLKYMGGHPEFPKPMDCRVYLYYDRIRLENPDLVISYRSLISIENMDEKKISAKRVIGLGLVAFPLAIVGAMWKKNHIYTVIQYNDAVGKKIIVLDFGEKVDEIQGWIYRSMISSMKSTILTFPEGDFIIYENKQYGFRMKYPRSWIRDELDQKNQDYIAVVEFRTCVENKNPFVTIYINDLESEQISFDDFVNREITVSKNDPNTSIIESSKLIIGNMTGAKLIDVEHNGFKRMVVWISSNYIVYEISYSTEQIDYLKNLPLVEKMVNSFQIIDRTLTIPNESSKTIELDEEEPLLILKRRFAKGEISEEEYLRMKRILE